MAPTNLNLQLELQAALDAARAAATVIQQFYLSGVEVRTKADQSPVTVADLRAEEVILGILSERFPSYAFYGEEGGRRAATATSAQDNLWLVDPIDGTKSFVRGCPFFSTQIALMREGRLVLGVSSASAYGELAWATRGGGAFLDGKPIQVSNVDQLGQCFLSTGNLKSLAASSAWSRFGNLVGQVNRLRGYGDFVHYHLLARGAVDAVMESDVNVLDIAALSVLVEEAGGRFTDLLGRSIGLDTTTVLASNGRLHDALAAAIRYQP